MKWSHFALVFFLGIFSSCSSGFGNKLQGEKLEIYFPNKDDEQIADQLGKFWHRKGLIGSKKQSIQLVKTEAYYKLKLIASETFDPQTFPVEERILLLDLQRELNDSIFAKTPCRIVICNNEFKELFDINS